MSSNSTLQKLMGGTSNIKEGLSMGVPDIRISKYFSNDGEDEGDGEKEKNPNKNQVTSPNKDAPKANVIGAAGTGTETPGSKRQASNTNAVMNEQQNITTNNILVFVIHVVFAIIIAYIWGILGSNALFLMTRSKKEKEYIFIKGMYPCFFDRCIDNF